MMTPEEYEGFVATAREQAQERMTRARQQYGVGAYARYEVDLPSATIRFFDAENTLQLRADIQVAGRWSAPAESWLWGWENESVPKTASALTVAVRELGEARDIPALRGAFTECDEGGAWSMAAIAAQVLDAECLYRVPRPDGHVFLLLFSLRRE
jgi:hypothetical protein